MTRSAWLKPCLWAAVVALLVCGLPAWSQGQTPAPSAPAAAAAPPPLAGDATIPVSGPSADDQAAGDPSGTKTGTANDVVHADATKPLTLADLVNQAGQNRIAINFTWTLVTGFLVMFMQAGFAIVETGLCRAKNANHTMMMNFMVYGFGLFAYWVCGFALQMGGAAGVSILGNAAPLSHEFTIHLLGHDWGLWGTKGFFLSGATYDVDTKPGVSAGPVRQGINTRFDEYQTSQVNPLDMPPDTNIKENITYAQYRNGSPSQSPSHTGVPGRRIVIIPIVKYAEYDQGRDTVKFNRFGQFFLQSKVGNGNGGDIQAEYIDDIVVAGKGGYDPNGGPANNLMATPVLYK